MTPTGLETNKLIIAKRAAIAALGERINNIYASIAACEKYLQTNHYSSSDIRETEQDIEAYEMEARNLMAQKTKLEQEVANLINGGGGNPGISR